MAKVRVVYTNPAQNVLAYRRFRNYIMVSLTRWMCPRGLCELCAAVVVVDGAGWQDCNGPSGRTKAVAGRWAAPLVGRQGQAPQPGRDHANIGPGVCDVRACVRVRVRACMRVCACMYVGAGACVWCSHAGVRVRVHTMCVIEQ